MKKSQISLEQVADWNNLGNAFYRAAKGRRGQPQVEDFRSDFHQQISILQHEILTESFSPQSMTRFLIRDPKPRVIHAPAFRERVLHHALMALVGPVLDNMLVFDTYACRVGKGTLAAVQRVQHHSRRYPWFTKIDIKSHFASIDHSVLFNLLQRRFRDQRLLALVYRILDAHHEQPGKGLPIGALTSQHFANFYLASLDRLLLDQPNVSAIARYMDDIIWWGHSRDAVRYALQTVRRHAKERLRLTVKDTVHTGRSRNGVMFCGFRVLPGALYLSRRGKRSYIEGRRRWEEAYANGIVDAARLQAGYAAVVGMTLHADTVSWRREQLRRSPLAESLVDA